MVKEARNESTLVHHIRQAIDEHYPNNWHMKVHGSMYQEVGLPDLLVCVDGHLFGMEVKHVKPGESRNHALGRVTDPQRRMIARMNTAGATAGAVLSVEDALNMIWDYFNID